MDKIIYHYTTIKQSLLIIESGFIKVSEYERKNNVKPPALWLSLNPLWENTATKMTKNIFGETVSLSFEEQHMQFGCARFLIEFNKDKLCSWAKYKHASNTTLEMYNQMEKVGFQKNANPKEWYASFKNISIDEVIGYQIWNGEYWEDLEIKKKT